MTKKKKFEDALSRLEHLVDEMESGEVTLDDMLKKYEEGTALIKFCIETLDKADKQIKTLSGNADDGYELEPINNNLK